MKLFFSKRAEKQFDNLNPRIKQKINNNLNKFINKIPIDIIKLKDRDNEFRIRAGNCRIELKKINKDFLITKIGKRENFYSIFLI